MSEPFFLTVHSEPRHYHYELAHTVMRKRVFSRPIQFAWNLTSFCQKGYLLGLIDKVERVHPTDEQIDFTADDIHINERTIAGRWSLVVQFPPPKFYTEVYFVAVVYQDEKRKAAEYYTLEYGSDDDGMGAAFLCGWDREGNHLHYHEVADSPNEEVFIENIEEVLTRSIRDCPD